MPDNQTTVQELKNLMNDFVAMRDWFQYHDPKNLSMSIAIEAAELMEHFQWLRSDQIDEALTDPDTRRQIEDELADILSFILSFANTLKIDLSDALQAKMKKNEQKYPPDIYRGKFKL